MAIFYGIKRKTGRITPPHQLPLPRGEVVDQAPGLEAELPVEQPPAPEPSPAPPLPAPAPEENPRALTIPPNSWPPPAPIE